MAQPRSCPSSISNTVATSSPYWRAQSRALSAVRHLQRTSTAGCLVFVVRRRIEVGPQTEQVAERADSSTSDNWCFTRLGSSSLRNFGQAQRQPGEQYRLLEEAWILNRWPQSSRLHSRISVPP